MALAVVFGVSVAPSWSVDEKTPSERIAATAKQSLGQKMWLGYGLPNGFLGCSAAVSNVLKKSGINCAHSAAVVIMRNQILKGPYSYQEFILKNGTDKIIDDALLLKTAQPGDILLAFMDPPSKPNTGGNAHCGIMGEKANVYTNDWNDGIWKEVNIHQMFDYYRHVRLLRLLPKAKSVEKAPAAKRQ